MSKSYQAKFDSVQLKVIIRYEGLKATQYFSKFTIQSDAVFRKDLVTLKLPHPKRENTTFVSHGCIECVWPSVTKDGTLHRHLITKANPHSPPEKKALENLLGTLSISSLVAKEIYPDAGKARKSLKRPNPFIRNEVEEERPSVAVPLFRPRNLRRLPPVTKVSHASTSLKPIFSQDVTDSFRPQKIPKIEPVDVPLPSDPSSRRVVRMSLSASSPSSRLPSTSEPTSNSGPVNQKLLQAKDLTSPSHASRASLLPSNPSPTTTSTYDLREIIRTSLPDRPLPIKEMLRELQPLFSIPQSLPEPAKHDFRVPDLKTRNATPILALQKSSEVTTKTDSRPKASDLPRIQRLTRESCDMRRQITADIVRDTDIISELKQLNATYIPHPLKIRDVDTTMEKQMAKLEQDLETERRMRLEAEDVINDMRRECKTPFIVPGLLDAFIKLSRLTTQATRSNGTDNS